MKNKSLITATLILLMAVGGYFVWQQQIDKSKEDEKEVVKIGVILPLTGDAAIYGQAMRNGIELALKGSEIKDRIKLIYQNDKGETKKSISVGQFVLTQNVEAVIGGAQSKTAEVIIPLFDTNNIPLISPGASSVVFDNISDSFFRLWPSDSYEGKILADYILKNEKNEKVAIFYTNSSYGESIQKAFRENLENKGVPITITERFDEGATDFKTQLLKIKESESTVLFLPGYISEVEKIIKQIVELGIKIDIYGTISLKDKVIQDLSKQHNLNVFYSQPSTSRDNIEQDAFIASYKKTYGEEPDVFAKNAYDCLGVVLYSIEKGASTSKEIINQLHMISDYNGVSGEFSFDKQGNVIKDFDVVKVNKTLELKKKE